MTEKINNINLRTLSEPSGGQAFPNDIAALRKDIEVLATKMNEIINVLNSFYTPQDPEYLKSKAAYYDVSDKP